MGLTNPEYKGYSARLIRLKIGEKTQECRLRGIKERL